MQTVIQAYPIPLGFETSARIPTDHVEIGLTVTHDSGGDKLALVCLVPVDPDDFVTLSLYCVPFGVPFDPDYHAVGEMYPGIYNVNGVDHVIFERKLIIK